MKTCVFALLLSTTSAYVLAPCRGTALAMPRAARSAWPVLQADDEPAAEAEAAPPAAADGPRDSPLAGLVGEDELKRRDFQAYKDQKNQEREDISSKTRVIIPGAFILFLGVAQLAGGRDAIKAFESGMGNPLDNTPGMAQAKQMTADQQARKEAKLDALRGVVDDAQSIE